MMHPLVAFCVLASVSGDPSGDICGINTDGTSTCVASGDQGALLQSRVQVEVFPEDSHTASAVFKDHVYGPVHSQTSLMEYFKVWAHGKIQSRLSWIIPATSKDDRSQSAIELESLTLSAAAASELLQTKIVQECPQKVSGFGGVSLDLLYAEHVSTDGIQHALMRDSSGHLQYLALFRSPLGSDEVVVSDPPACDMIQHGTFFAGLEGPTTGDVNTLALDDPTVEDCKKLFVRTFEENCPGSVDIKVGSAQQGITRGLAIQLHAAVCLPGSANMDDCKMHRPICKFETPNTPDASLLEDTSSPLPLEKAGLEATLVLSVPLCEAPARHGMSMSEADDTSLLFEFGLGELSLSKGYEHLLPSEENTENTSFAIIEDRPAELDFRKAHAKCYPSVPGKGPGTEVVRNQGSCGTCWAFSSASATMANLCISGNGKDAFASPTDRYEISVQKIISCKQNGRPMRGCNGGNIQGFAAQAKAYGLTRERDNKYACGSGDARKHFTQHNNCKEFAWGGACTGKAYANWHWDGYQHMRGVDQMESSLVSGLSMWVAFTVYHNFFRYRSGVYQESSGGKAGGHAVNCIGYGTDGGVKYWLIQNSWGYGWGDHGFFKIKKGSNFCGIEGSAYAPKAHVSGGGGGAPPAPPSGPTQLPPRPPPAPPAPSGGYKDYAHHMCSGTSHIKWAGKHTLAECKEICDKTPQCKAVQFFTPSSCLLRIGSGTKVGRAYSRETCSIKTTGNPPAPHPPSPPAPHPPAPHPPAPRPSPRPGAPGKVAAAVKETLEKLKGALDDILKRLG